MVTPPPDAAPSATALASDCADLISASPATVATDPVFASAFSALLAALSASNVRYEFDREGRPAAVAAVRRALPAMEAELLDAVIEDVECELAATREALRRIVTAVTSRDGRSAMP